MLSRVRDNYTSFRKHVNRALIRPDPTGMPDWILDSRQLTYTLRDSFGPEFTSMIRDSVRYRAETGCWLCYEPREQRIVLGNRFMGGPYHVVIKDCTGMEHIGAFHVHLGLEEPLFSPPDLQQGLSEYVMAVGGEHLDSQKGYSMSVLSPFKYWGLSSFEKDQIDDHLNTATILALEMNYLAHHRTEDWQELYTEFNRRYNLHMEKVFALMDMLYVPL